MRCYLACPMINEYGYCESAMRKVERVCKCPHDKLRLTMQREHAPPKEGRNG